MLICAVILWILGLVEVWYIPGPTLEVDLNFMFGAIILGGPPYNSLEFAILYSITADSA